MVTASGLSAPQPCQDRRRGETVGNEPDRGLVVAHRGARLGADILLVPQLTNARRFDCDLDPYPTLVRIDATCRALPAFLEAAPENQPDAMA